MVNKKNIFILLFLLIASGSMFVISSAIKKQQGFQKKATDTAHPGTFSLSSSVTSYSKGAVFSADINIATGGRDTSGAAVIINFDPNVLEVLQVIPGKDITQQPPMYPQQLRNENTTQEIRLDYGIATGNPPVYYNGQGIFGRINFKVKDNAPVGQSQISFVLNNLSTPFEFGDCDISVLEGISAVDVLGQVTNLAITVSSETNATVTQAENPPTATLTPQATATLTSTLTPLPTATPTLVCESSCFFGPEQCNARITPRAGYSCQISSRCTTENNACPGGPGNPQSYWCYAYCQTAPIVTTTLTPTLTPTPTSATEPVATATGGILPTATTTISACPQKTRGDADCNNVVNINDFFRWRNEFLQINTEEKTSDFNGDNVVNINDFFAWRTGFLSN